MQLRSHFNFWGSFPSTESSSHNWWRNYDSVTATRSPAAWWRGYETTETPYMATTETPEETPFWEYVLRAVLYVIQSVGQFEVEHLTLTLFVVTVLCVSSFVLCFVSLCKAFRNRKSKKSSSKVHTAVGYIQPIYVNHSSGEVSLNGPPKCNCSAKWAGDFDSIPTGVKDNAGERWEQDCVKQLENWKMEKDVLRL